MFKPSVHVVIPLLLYTTYPTKNILLFQITFKTLSSISRSSFSMFERLLKVINPYVSAKQQRKMRPKAERKLLSVIRCKELALGVN